jgi:hypothetical protein
MDDSICAICYEEMNIRDDNLYHDDFDKNKIDDKTIMQLKCGHKFHYKCIMMTFTNSLKKYNGSKTRRCPFCRSNGGYLPLKPKTFPIKNIHNEFDLIKYHVYHNEFDEIYKIAKENEFLNEDKCQALLTTGNNKGVQCKKNKKKDCNYCAIHLKKNINICENYKLNAG